MPKKDETDETIETSRPVPCDGCSLPVPKPVELAGCFYCSICYDIRKDDPPITVHGRTLLLSELTAQAWDGDVDLKAALDGDTVQDQIKAAKKR